MLGRSNMSSDQNEKNNRGVSSDDLNEVISMSLEFAKRHQAVLILLCGSIVENYDVFLNNLTTQMYNCGMIDGQTVEKKGLLQILSGNLPVETVVRELVGTGNAIRKLRYISSFHQMQYDMKYSMSLLNKLQTQMINNQMFSPIVLNVPMDTYLTVKDICPELWNNSLRYIKKGDVLQSGYHTTAKEKRVMIETESPWYIKNNELFETEKEGIRKIAKKYDINFETSALPKSKRLNCKFIMRLKLKDMIYELHMRIVYPETFSENHLDVGIVIENADEKMKQEISWNKCCKRTIYRDPEFDRLFIIQRVCKESNESAAATALEGFLELFNSYS